MLHLHLAPEQKQRRGSHHRAVAREHAVRLDLFVERQKRVRRISDRRAESGRAAPRELSVDRRRVHADSAFSVAPAREIGTGKGFRLDLVRFSVVRTRLLLQRGDVSVEAGGEHGFGDGRGGRLGVPRRARVIRPPERGFRVKPLLRLPFVVTF